MAWGVTLIALLYGISAWQARHAWNAYRTAYEAQVASLDIKTYAPKEIPDAENFAAIPLVRAWFDNGGTNWTAPFGQDRFSRVAAASGVSLLCERGGEAPHCCDLVAWRDAFAAADQTEGLVTNRVLSGQFDARSRAQAAPAVLGAIKDDDEVWSQMRQASTRPGARYPINYNADDPWSIRLPHLAKIKGSCLRLQLRACAELALNQSSNALADIKLALYLADSLKDEPILVSWLVRAVSVQAAIGPVWEGLAEHRWSQAQLQELQSLFEHYDFAAGLETSLHLERAAGILTADLIGRRDLPELSQVSDLARVPFLIARFAPSGWRDREKLQYCRLFDLQFQGVWAPAPGRFSPSQTVSNAVALRSAVSGSLQPILRHRLIARMLLPPLSRTPFKAATTQTSTDLAGLACALEHYRLANGQFPANLQALRPNYLAALPNDVITGKPYEYHQTSDGRFTLNSAGGDDTGAGGISDKGLLNQISQWFAVKKGDWTWSYPRD